MTAGQEITIGIHDHKQFVTRFIAVARVKEVLQGDWALRGADDVDFLSLGATKKICIGNHMISSAIWNK